MSPQERKLEQARSSRQLWSESEWRLNFLRSFSGQPLTHPTDEELRLWDQHCKTSCSVWQAPPTISWT